MGSRISRRQSGLILVGLVLLSINLRPAAVSVGPVLAEIRAELAMSPTEAGLLTSLPVVAFAGFGALSPWLARLVGIHRVTLLALACVVVGLGARALVGDSASFLALTMVALAGMATANVLIPSLVKWHFPDRIGRVTAVYTTALAVGLTLALVLTVPLAEGLGGWRWGLGSWALVGLLALLPWLGLAAHDRHLDPGTHTVTFGQVARTRLGWAMALFFGLQSAMAYAIFGWFAQLWRDQGFSASEAGLLVGGLAAVGIPLSLWLPAAVAQRSDQRRLLAVVIGLYPIGFLGLIVAPPALAPLWALLIGIAACTFPIILTLIGLRAHTAQATAALSSFTQSVGYLLAVAGPFLVGAIFDATGSWTWPLLFLTVLTVPLMATAMYVARPRFLEDQLPAR